MGNDYKWNPILILFNNWSEPSLILKSTNSAVLINVLTECVYNIYRRV